MSFQAAVEYINTNDFLTFEGFNPEGGKSLTKECNIIIELIFFFLKLYLTYKGILLLQFQLIQY